MLSYSKLSSFSNSIEMSEIVFSCIAIILTLHKIQKTCQIGRFMSKKCRYNSLPSKKLRRDTSLNFARNGIYSGGKKKATHKIIILDPKNRKSLVAKFIFYTRSLLVTLFFWFYVKSFSCLPSGSKLLGKDQNSFTCKFS